MPLVWTLAIPEHPAQRTAALFLDQPPFNVPMQLLFEAPASSVLRNPGERIRTFLRWP
jgi:hypothetical protein